MRAGVVDLRSDTVTRPSAAMREAMAQAPVGDDVYGEDPTVNELEARVASLLGHEAGLFTPSGSLANQLGLRLLVEPGQEFICDSEAHVVRAELGAAATFSGITTRTWPALRGRIDVDEIARTIRPDGGPYLVSTVAVAVENTHNFGGGTIQPVEDLRKLRAVADEAGLLLHLDGARLWNAHIVTGTAFSEYGELFDTVSVCLSKGLGAPVGSVLVSSAERVARARIWRKRMGAGMRQAGILAAAGLYALDHNISRLAEDHRRASYLADRLAPVATGVLDPGEVETNIVPLVVDDAAGFAVAARERGVLISVLGPRKVRLVTHLDIDDTGVEMAATALSELLAPR